MFDSLARHGTDKLDRTQYVLVPGFRAWGTGSKGRYIPGCGFHGHRAVEGYMADRRGSKHSAHYHTRLNPVDRIALFQGKAKNS